jgi:hypothetical protein
MELIWFTRSKDSPLHVTKGNIVVRNRKIGERKHEALRGSEVSMNPGVPELRCYDCLEMQIRQN